MPTLGEITLAHSKRISRISQDRDARLRAATDARDRDLRALANAAPLYDAFDREIEEARGKQAATDAKAESAREASLQDASDTLSQALADAQLARREADVAASEKRRKAEEDAEHEFILAIGATPAAPTSTQAQKVRAEKLEKAKKDFDAALAASQEQFRKSRDAAMVAESRASREADRAFTATVRASESSLKVARASAEQALAKALAALPEGAAEFAEWRTETAAILADFRRAENEEFERFHREVQALKG
jgi:hypothetical protein